MSFWAYLLHCRGGMFHAGHTDDLERRIAEHKSGLIPGFTARYLPVELVWSEEFQTRDDAKAVELKLKGWSKAKKLALIRGDWALISALAKKKGDASTSSAQTGVGEGEVLSVLAGPESGEPLKPVRPELVQGLSFSLLPHPNHLPLAVTRIDARLLALTDHWLTLRWRIEGAGQVLVPPLAGKRRANGLWRTTCFELFVRSGEDEGYAEFNLSPSERWAAYDFTAYREGMAERSVPREPVCTLRGSGPVLIFDAAIPRAALPPLPWAFGLSAVIEEEGGRISYWALAHPPGKPDFHHPACFAATLPAPGGA